MKRILLLIAINIIMLTGLSQNITGPDQVCEGEIADYILENDDCDDYTGIIIWKVFDEQGDQVAYQYGVNVGNSTDNAHEFTMGWAWSSMEGTTFSIEVSYKCNYENEEGKDVTESLTDTLTVTVIQMQTPLLSETEMSLYCGEGRRFELTTPTQDGTGFEYDWDLPECFSTDGTGNSIVVTPDLASEGEICLTVSHPGCGLSETECITITRRCRDIKTYLSGDIVPDYTSVNNYIRAEGDFVVVGGSSNPVEFRAGQMVILGPGFSARPEFLAYIAPCECKPSYTEGCYYGDGKSGQVFSQDIETDEYSGNKLSRDDFELKSEADLSDSKETLLAFPNPTTGLTTIKVDGWKSESTYHIRITGIDGKLVYSNVLGNGQVYIDFSAYESGIYLIQVSNGQNLLNAKLIKSE